MITTSLFWQLVLLDLSQMCWFFLNCYIIKTYGLFSSECFLSALSRDCSAQQNQNSPNHPAVARFTLVPVGNSRAHSTITMIRGRNQLNRISVESTILWQTGVNKSRHRLIQSLRSMRICLAFSECWIRSSCSMGEEELLHQAVGAGNSANIDLAW